MNIGDNVTPPAKKAPAKKAAPARKPAAKTAPIGTQKTPTGYLNFAQLEALAMHAGASQSEAVTLAAIAMAESQGKVGALNDNQSTGDLSYGLWQINMLGGMGPDRRTRWGLSSNNDLFNPLTNARAAVSLLRANNGYGDWTTYTSGAYSNYLTAAEQALPQAHSVNVASIKPAKGAAVDSSGIPTNNGSGDVNTYFDQNVAQQYGYLSAYLKDPEIGPILKQAAAQGWGQNKLLSALEPTHWWQSMSQNAREMQAMQRTDKASYKELFSGKLTQVQSLATSLGIQVDPKRLNQLATTALWSNWSPLQIQQAVGAEFHYKPGQAYTGTVGADIQAFKKHAAEYLVPMSDQTLGTWVQQAAQGKINPDDFTGYLSQQAKTLYPWMSKAIDAGVTPTTYLDPYRQAAAQTLELDPNSINFTDPKWLGLVQTVDPKTGTRAETGLANAMTTLRTNPIYGYDHTQGAIQQASAFATNLAHQFGAVGSASGMTGVSNPTAA